jgi:hypothetical protein
MRLAASALLMQQWQPTITISDPELRCCSSPGTLKAFAISFMVVRNVKIMGAAIYQLPPLVKLPPVVKASWARMISRLPFLSAGWIVDKTRMPAASCAEGSRQQQQPVGNITL